MARLRFVVACVAIFVLAFMLQFKNVNAAREDALNQLSTIINVKLRQETSTLDITCGTSSGKPFIQRIYNTYIVTAVHVFNCPSPRDSYVELLELLEVNVAAVEEITLYGIPGDSVLHSRHFGSMPIKTLNIYAAHGRPLLRPDADFLSQLRELKKLTVENADLHPLPASVQLEMVNLKGGSSLGGFGGCEHLTFLILEQWEVPSPSDGAHWLAHCPKLVSVILKDLKQHTPMRIVEGADKLNYLVMVNCSINELKKDILASAKNLNQLHLYHNGMTSIASNAFESQSSLTNLDLSHNDLTAEALEPIRSLRSLQSLYASHNRLHDFCDHFPADAPLAASISQLSLSDTGLTRVCFANWTSLALVNLTNNNIDTLDLDQLPLAVIRPRALGVSLYGNPLRDLVFPEELYHRLNSLRQTSSTPHSSSPRRFEPFASIDAEMTMSCTCSRHWLSMAIREGLIEASNLRCDDGTSLAKASHHFSRCPGVDGAPGGHHDMGGSSPGEHHDMGGSSPGEHHDMGGSSPGGRPGGGEFNCDGCQCYRDQTGAVVANCASRSNTAVPRVTGMREVHASGNSIQKLEADDFPDTLMMLDITGNQVSHVDELAAEAMFAASARHVRLVGNPIACDCDNVQFLSLVHNHDKQVLDFNELMCSSGQMVRRVSVDDLCVDTPPSGPGTDTHTKDRAMLVVAGAVSVVFAILTIVFV